MKKKKKYAYPLPCEGDGEPMSEEACAAMKERFQGFRSEIAMIRRKEVLDLIATIEALRKISLDKEGEARYNGPVCLTSGALQEVEAMNPGPTTP